MPPLSSPRVGAVLSSGGVRGVYAHTGFLLALEKLGVRLEALAGCSAGAVVGGIVASGQQPAAWADALATVHPAQFWRPRLPRLLWTLIVHQGRGCTGLSSTAPAGDFAQTQLQANTFEECVIPFHALAVHVATGTKTIFSEGELLPAMLASAAVPLLYEPVEIKGEWYCDGALLDLAPTDAICCQHDLDILIIHHVAQRHEGKAALERAIQQSWTMVELLNMLLYQRRPWYLSEEPVTFLHCPCGCGAEIIILEPDLPLLAWPVTTSGPQVLSSARQQARNNLEPHASAIDGTTEFAPSLFEEVTGPGLNSGCRS